LSNRPLIPPYVPFGIQRFRAYVQYLVSFGYIVIANGCEVFVCVNIPIKLYNIPQCPKGNYGIHC